MTQQARADPAENLFGEYDPGRFFCELTRPAAAGDKHAQAILERLSGMNLSDLIARSRDAERELYNLGITFTVYDESSRVDRILPFDVIPRPISGQDWRHLNAGVQQRVTAINLFLHDIYHDGKILKDGVVPPDLIHANRDFVPGMVGFDPPGGTYAHISGIDVVRDEAGDFRVLEDNVRAPSGVSYVLENRHLMLRSFPDLMADLPVQPVFNYGIRLREALVETAPAGIDEPQVVLLSPGVFNSAHFEHVFLAREMGVPLVEGHDLFVGEDDKVYMKTITGPERVDVIYRRTSDAFIDPESFNPNSMLGIRGLFRAYLRGNVTLANAIGTGVADDKAIYAYMPRIIHYYLDQEPILKNVPTYICREKEDLSYVLDNLSEMVTKPVGEAGGYGVVVGPASSRETLSELRDKILANPAGFIAQPLVGLSVCPTVTDSGLRPRHVDLRPFCVTGEQPWVLPGGLSRVALREGSFIVNSSQGGGSKDTWILD